MSFENNYINVTNWWWLESLFLANITLLWFGTCVLTYKLVLMINLWKIFVFFTVIKNMLKILNIDQGVFQHLEDTEKSAFKGLPELNTIHTFICDVLLTITAQCLKSRLEQTLTCQQNCQSSSSLLTIQQVVLECKEVKHFPGLIHN